MNESLPMNQTPADQAPGADTAAIAPDLRTSPGAEPAAGLCPRLGRNFRLQWEEVQKAWVLLYPEGMVKLNLSAGEILKRCDGTRRVDDIVADLEKAFDTTGLVDEVRAFCAIASKQRWIEYQPPADAT